MKSKIKKIFLFSIFFICIVFYLFPWLTSCSPIKEELVINSLLPNLWVFLAHIIAAVILLLTTIFLIWKPTKKFLQKRQEKINNDVNEAQNLKVIANQEIKDANRIKMEALNQALDIVTKAKTNAFNLSQKVKNETKISIEKMKQEAKNNLYFEEQKMKKNMQNTTLNLAFEIAQNILQKNLKKQDINKDISSLLKMIDKDHKEE